MGADMVLRSLYLPTGRTINHTAATDSIRRLCREATTADLRVLIDHGWTDDEVPYSEDTWTDEALAARAVTLRQAAETKLLQRFDDFACSLGHRDVIQHRFDSGDEGIDAYQTGAGSAGAAVPPMPTAPGTSSSTPAGCRTGQIGAAAGLLHPWGDGPAVTTVAFRAWA